ncbi:MAG: hypothetical protein IH897_03480 [Planctomycetes bacterium]|nr:hypothetical protein [Planctomycetota bacterium]
MMIAKRQWNVVWVMATLVALHAAHADEPRARSLEYTPTSKAWVEVPPPAPGTPEGDLHQIRMWIKNEKYRTARRAINKFIKRHGEIGELYPAVLIAKAEVLIGQRKFDKAHRSLQEFLSEFGGGSLTAEALRLEFVIAETYFTGVKRKFLGFRVLSGVDIAHAILDDISVNYSQTPFAGYAIKTKADYLFANGDHALAEFEYARLLKDYPNSQYRQYALRRSAEAALASFAGVEYDDAALIEAEERYRNYLAQYGAMAEREGVDLIIENIRERRAEKLFVIGDYYERTNHLSSAVHSYRLVAARWPHSVAAGKAASRLALLSPAGPVAGSAG